MFVVLPASMLVVNVTVLRPLSVSWFAAYIRPEICEFESVETEILLPAINEGKPVAASMLIFVLELMVIVPVATILP